MEPLEELPSQKEDVGKEEEEVGEEKQSEDVETEQHNDGDKQRRRTTQQNEYGEEQSHGLKGYAPAPAQAQAQFRVSDHRELPGASSQRLNRKPNDGFNMYQYREDDIHGRRKPPLGRYINQISPPSEYERRFQRESTVYSDCEEEGYSSSPSASSEPSSRSDYHTGETMASSLPETRGFAQKTKFGMYGRSSAGPFPKNTMRAANPESLSCTDGKAGAYPRTEFPAGKQNRPPPLDETAETASSASTSINMGKNFGYDVPRKHHFHEESRSPQRVDTSSYGESISSNLYKRLRANFSDKSKAAWARKLSQTGLLEEGNPVANASASYANSTNDAFTARRELPRPFNNMSEPRYSAPTRPPPDIMAKSEQDLPYSSQQQSPPYAQGNRQDEGRTPFGGKFGHPPYVVGQPTDGEKHDLSSGMSTPDNEPYHTGGEYFPTSESGQLSDLDPQHQQQRIPPRNPNIFMNINGYEQSSLDEHDETGYGSSFETGSMYQDVKFNGDPDVLGPNMNQDLPGQLSPTQLKSESKAFPDKYYKADTNTIKKVEKLLRVGCAVSSLIAFAVMISTSEIKVAAGSTFHVKFSDYQAYTYLVSINLLALIYSLAQLLVVGHQKTNILSSPVKRGACLYICDQIIAFLLISSSSSAATASELSRSGLRNIWPPACSTWKLWLFCSKADGATIMSFFSAIFVLGSSFASGYRFSKLLAE